MSTRALWDGVLEKKPRRCAKERRGRGVAGGQRLRATKCCQGSWYRGSGYCTEPRRSRSNRTPGRPWGPHTGAFCRPGYASTPVYRHLRPRVRGHLRPRVCGHLRPRTRSLVPTSAPQRVRGGEGEGGGRGGGMRTTLFHAASTTTSSNDHIQSPMRPARPATGLATGEREEGGGGTGGRGGATLLHAASTTIQSRPHPVTHAASMTSRPPRKRGEGEGGGRGMITTVFHAASTVTTSTLTRRGRGMRGEEEGGGRSPATHAALEGGRGRVRTTLFHAASTVTTSTRPARPVMRGGRGEGEGGESLQPPTRHWRGDDNDLVSRGQHDYIQSHSATGVMGEGRGKAGGGITTFFASTTSHSLCKGEKGGRGDDTDFVSRDQRDHIQSPAPQRVRGGREGEGGSDNDLLLRGQHDHIQSPATQWTYKRLCWRLFRSFLEVVSCVQSRGRGDGGGGGAGRLQTSDPSRLCTQGEGGRGGLGGLGVYRHLTQGRLSTQGLRSVASRFTVRVSGFGLQGSGLGSQLQGLGFLCRGLVHEEPRSRSSWDAPRHIGGIIPA